MAAEQLHAAVFLFITANTRADAVRPYPRADGFGVGANGVRPGIRWDAGMAAANAMAAVLPYFRANIWADAVRPYNEPDIAHLGYILTHESYRKIALFVCLNSPLLV